MNMFARFDENPAMTLEDIKETKRYGRTDGCTDGRTDARTDARTDGRTDGQRENSIPTTNKVCGGYKKLDSQLSLYQFWKQLVSHGSELCVSRVLKLVT